MEISFTQVFSLFGFLDHLFEFLVDETSMLIFVTLLSVKNEIHLPNQC